MTPRQLALLLVLSLIWGASFLFIKVVVEDTSPIALVQARMVFGALTMVAVMAWRRLSLAAPPAFMFKVAVLAVLSNVIPFLLISWGEIHIASGLASVLNSSTPLFTALFAAILLAEERLAPAAVAGLLVGFLGVIVLTGGDILDFTRADVLGQLAVVAASACYGLGAVFARSLLRAKDPLSLAGLQLVLGSVVLIPALFATAGGAPDYSLSAQAWGSLLALGILGTGMAYIIFLWLLEATGPVKASTVTYIIPIVGLFLGWAVLDESIGLNTVFGGALIIGGVAMVTRSRGEGLATAEPSEGRVRAVGAGEAPKTGD
ncbi:MAG: DMT family transporter [Dehalococcoidia bacterium]